VNITPESPLVTVVMPFLNAEKFIQDSVQSILAQTYGNWELIFVDDGSSDSRDIKTGGSPHHATQVFVTPEETTSRSWMPTTCGFRIG
jgi:hypothetical protein